MTELLDEVDLAVVHALQVAPRAPWTQVGAAVGVDAATAARHWDRLAAERLAWWTVWPTPEQWSRTADVAVVRVRPGPGALDAVADRWCALPWVLGVDETPLGLVAVAAGDAGLAALAARVREQEAEDAPLEHVALAQRVLREDSTWRLRVLAPRQLRVLEPPAGPTGATGAAGPTGPSGQPGPGPATTPGALVDEVAAVLRDDVRTSHAALGRRLGVSEATARRALARVARAGALRFGCDVAMPAVGLGRGVLLTARAVGDDREGALARVVRDPAVHRVAELVDDAPLLVALRTATLERLPELERGWGGAVEVVGRTTVVRARKRNGHLLDVDGRSRGHVTPAW
ncbi:AsnC family protein [Nocardioides zeae]|uniref:AsnC family protein n=1 Tax=Nocardioides zeae TaxID=1457234 RepID=A0A6P0HK07_9ACTN|nr:AsnC family protein [Nocardioides zeae]NEN78564.1 AsnC family protein [Nocardioides zeae]